MTTYTMRLDDPAAADPHVTGGKGAGLAALTAAGFPVPAGFVVTTTGYHDGWARTSAGRAGRQHQAAATPMPAPIAAQILAAYDDLGAPSVAVRSSGTAEDLADASFAGQHDTYLGVTGSEALLGAVADCWASLWTPRAIAYRQHAGHDERDLALAVVVQTMVDAEWAGVLFTADPLSGRRDRIVLEAVPGLADALASGEQTGRSAVWDKRAGTAVSDDAGLPAGVLAQLADLATRVEEHFASPQDIEWAYAAGRCWLVQSRRLTALPPSPDTEPVGSTAPRRIPMNAAMLAEHIPAPPFPMDVSVVLRPGLRAVLGALGRAGLSVPPLDEVLVETSEGVVRLVPPSIRPTRRAVLGVPLAAPKLLRLLRTTPAAWRTASAATILPLARRLDTEDLSALTDGEIIERVGRLRDTVGRLVASRFGAVPAGMLAGRVGRTLLRLMVAGDADRLHDDLMCAVPSVTTASNAELGRIADRVRSTPELRTAYAGSQGCDVAERLATSAAGRALLEQIDGYLRRYGFRETSMLSIGSPPLRDVPDTVHGLIAGLARHEPSGRPDPNTRLQRARRELAGRRGVRARLLRPTIVRLLRAARSSAGFREDSHYQFMMALAVTRRLLLELGRRLVERGTLTEPGDVLYLELDEIEGLDQQAIRASVARRRAARTAALPGYTIIPTDLLASGDGADGVRGTPSSGGSAVGRVRVVRDESEFASLQPGEVLVCPYTNPTWTPLFSLAAAVVADSGGAASHAAIVAREYGIPAVMGTGNATRRLGTGERVLVDGDRGVVSRLQTGAQQAAPVG